jgi:glucokinase
MSAGETIGVDLGGTKALVGVLDGTEVRYESREASTGQSEDELVELLICEIGEAREARPDVTAVGLGIPATIDHEAGVAIAAVNLPLTDVPIREIIGERVGLPVFVDNDANVAALAEYLFGAARGKPTTVMLTVGTGIGGGLILGGEVFRGSTGAAPGLTSVAVTLQTPAVL